MSKKAKAWVNIYLSNGKRHEFGRLFRTKKEAVKTGKFVSYGNFTYIKTVQIKEDMFDV